MTIDDLHQMFVACAGEAENFSLSDHTIDCTFEELGYDSLARMEVASRITKEFGVSIPDDLVMELRTPREVLDLVNGTLTRV